MIGGAAAAIDQEQLESDGEMYQRAKAVYDSLVGTKGNYQLTAPPFYISRDDQNGAFLEVDNQSIGLEKKAYDLCMTMDDPDAAMAAILGHELIHFYEKHLYLRTKMTKFQTRYQKKSLEAIEDAAQRKKLKWTMSKDQENLVKTLTETEADYLGGFLAYAAGYSITDLPALYTKLYELYPIKEDSPGYATLAERKEMAETAQKRLNEFIDIYDVANLLLVADRFEDARLLYKYILQEYQGREVYNNLGVLTVLEAMTYFGPEEKKYQVPLTLDFSFGVNSRDPSEEDIRTRNQLLQEALGYFQSAISMDPNYTPAYLNQACVYYLRKDERRARYFAEVEVKAPQRANTKNFQATSIKADVLIALLNIRAGEEAAARKLLEANQDVLGLAKANLMVLNQEAAPRGQRSESLYWEIEKIRKRDIGTKAVDMDKSRDLEIFQKSKLRVWGTDVALTKSKIYRFSPYRNVDRPDIYFMITEPGYDILNDDDLGVGTPGDVIVDEYGEPKRILGSVNGELWIYNDTILFMDKNKKVRRYAQYYIE